MTNEARTGFYMEEEERELSQFLESGGALPKSVLAFERKRALEAMAQRLNTPAA